MRVVQLFLSLAFLAFIYLFVSLFAQSTEGLSDGRLFLAINSDKGVANAVTSIVTSFRGLDTIGEVMVLFLAVSGVKLFIEEQDFKGFHYSFLLHKGAQLLFPLIALFGIYIIVYGHLSAGGGFQGGVVIASGFLLLFLSGVSLDIHRATVHILETSAMVLILALSIFALFYMGIFMGNIAPTGEFATLFSGGVLPLIYILIGIKVASEITLLTISLIRSDNAH
jgi:multicomponent Na+:H+ antiporter subunit B